MNRFALFAPLALLAVSPLTANALLITPSTAPCGTGTCLLTTGTQTSQAEINTAIAGLLGGSVELYKQNVGGSETGAFASSYSLSTTRRPIPRTRSSAASAARS